MCHTAHLGDSCDWCVRARMEKIMMRNLCLKRILLNWLDIIVLVSTINHSQKRLKKDVEPFYPVIYKLSGGADENFILPCHGNSIKPSVVHTPRLTICGKKKLMLCWMMEYPLIRYVLQTVKKILVLSVKL